MTSYSVELHLPVWREQLFAPLDHFVRVADHHQLLRFGHPWELVLSPHMSINYKQLEASYTTYLEVRDRMGKNLHALFTAPNPDSSPRITVPTTVSRANTTLVVPVDVKSPGKGTNERRKRKRPTGSAVRNSRVVLGRCKPCKPDNS